MRHSSIGIAAWIATVGPMPGFEPQANLPPRSGRFVTTNWNLLLTAKDSASAGNAPALETLCRAYWYPLYVYARRRGCEPAEAEDMIQEFFARLIEKSFLQNIHPEKGRFRSFLLAALNNFLAKEWTRANRQKRGGGTEILSFDEMEVESRYQAEASHALTPERAFERRWALEILDRTMQRLADESAGARKKALFADLKPFLSGEKSGSTYADIASRHATTEAAIKMTVSRLRKRYGELLRAEIAATVESEAEVEEEIRFLFAAVRTS